MLNRRMIEVTVGFLMLLGIVSFVVLAFQVSGLRTVYSSEKGYQVTAYFDNIGGLKTKARVTVAGVSVGKVMSIQLDPKTYQAKVVLFLDSDLVVPDDSAASILTAGLLGDNYISLEPGAEETSLKNGDIIQETHSAMILERLIGQFLFNKDK